MIDIIERFISATVLPAMHAIPASWSWLHLLVSSPACVHSNNLFSRPLHITLSRRTGPLPCPKAELGSTVAPVHVEVEGGRWQGGGGIIE